MAFLEGFANAAVGLLVSIAAVHVLRAVGLWDASALWVSTVFFCLSWLRSWALRAIFGRLA